MFLTTWSLFQVSSISWFLPSLFESSTLRALEMLCFSCSSKFCPQNKTSSALYVTLFPVDMRHAQHDACLEEPFVGHPVSLPPSPSCLPTPPSLSLLARPWNFPVASSTLLFLRKKALRGLLLSEEQVGNEEKRNTQRFPTGRATLCCQTEGQARQDHVLTRGSSCQVLHCGCFHASLRLFLLSICPDEDACA